MPTIDQRELGICVEQQNEEWEVLSVRPTLGAVHAVLIEHFDTVVHLL
jgi:hypothetical protein